MVGALKLKISVEGEVSSFISRRIPWTNAVNLNFVGTAFSVKRMCCNAFPRDLFIGNGSHILTNVTYDRSLAVGEMWKVINYAYGVLLENLRPVEWARSCLQYYYHIEMHCQKSAHLWADRSLLLGIPHKRCSLNNQKFLEKLVTLPLPAMFELRVASHLHLRTKDSLQVVAICVKRMRFSPWCEMIFQLSISSDSSLYSSSCGYRSLR